MLLHFATVEVVVVPLGEEVGSGGVDAGDVYLSQIVIGECLVSAMKNAFLKYSATNTFSKHLPLTHQNN